VLNLTAARLDLHRGVVSKWRKRFFEEGLAGLEERPRGATPGLFPPEVVVAARRGVRAAVAPSGCRWPACTSPTSPAEVRSRGIVA